MAMINILLSDFSFDEKWAYENLKRILKKEDKVCICALTFFDDTKTIEDWNRQFKKGQGYYYRLYQDVFKRYGIHSIEWIEYFNDSYQQMKEKIERSSVLYIPGGAPDLFMKRIRECRIKKVLKNYKGIVIGVSAGAMVQLDCFHITPDDEYSDFQYMNGLGYLQDFDIEVHYTGSNQQKKYIKKVIEEKQIPVFGIKEKGGMIIQNNQIECFGQIEKI